MDFLKNKEIMVEMKEKTKMYILFVLLFLLCWIGKCSAQTIECVKTHLNASQIQNKDIVLKQIILETGWLTSYSCKHRHNLFGFRYKGKYLEFTSWEESIDYYFRWQKKHYKGGDYYKFLKEVGYATDPNYITKLKSIKI
jgi:flagellum-specific peptidoglycan hydrolase FlgJ